MMFPIDECTSLCRQRHEKVLQGIRIILPRWPSRTHFTTMERAHLSRPPAPPSAAFARVREIWAAPQRPRMTIVELDSFDHDVLSCVPPSCVAIAVAYIHTSRRKSPSQTAGCLRNRNMRQQQHVRRAHASLPPRLQPIATRTRRGGEEAHLLFRQPPVTGKKTGVMSETNNGAPTRLAPLYPVFRGWFRSIHQPPTFGSIQTGTLSRNTKRCHAQLQQQL